MSALLCAQRLNFKCREAGYPLPNPDVGFSKPGKRGPRKGVKRRISGGKRKVKKQIKVKVEKNANNEAIPFPSAILSSDFDKLRRQPFSQKQLQVTRAILF